MSAVDYLEPGLAPLTGDWIVQAGGVDLSTLTATGTWDPGTLTVLIRAHRLA